MLPPSRISVHKITPDDAPAGAEFARNSLLCTTGLKAIEVSANVNYNRNNSKQIASDSA